MKLLKEDIQFPDFKLDDKLKKFLNLDEVKEAFKESDIQKIYDMYTRYRGYESNDNNITMLFFNLGINPLTYLVDIPDYTFYGIDLNPLTFNNQLRYIGYKSFMNNKAVQSISIPDSCEKIEAFAFANCLNLHKVHLGNNIQELGNGCFYSDSKLTSVTLPRSLQSINLSSFLSSGVEDLSYTGTADDFIQKLENKTLIGLDIKITKVSCSDKLLDLKEYFNQPELIQPDITNATGLFRIRTTNSYTLTARKYDPKSNTFGFGWTANQGVVHSSEITFTSESEANDFIEKANLRSDIKLGRTNKPYDLYKVDTQAGPCYLTKQYIKWLLWDSVMNNKDINKKLPSRLIVRP